MRKAGGDYRTRLNGGEVAFDKLAAELGKYKGSLPHSIGLAAPVDMPWDKPVQAYIWADQVGLTCRFGPATGAAINSARCSRPGGDAGGGRSTVGGSTAPRSDAHGRKWTGEP